MGKSAVSTTADVVGIRMMPGRGLSRGRTEMERTEWGGKAISSPQVRDNLLQRIQRNRAKSVGQSCGGASGVITEHARSVGAEAALTGGTQRDGSSDYAVSVGAACRRAARGLRAKAVTGK